MFKGVKLLLKHVPAFFFLFLRASSFCSGFCRFLHFSRFLFALFVAQDVFGALKESKSVLMLLIYKRSTKESYPCHPFLFLLLFKLLTVIIVGFLCDSYTSRPSMFCYFRLGLLRSRTCAWGARYRASRLSSKSKPTFTTDPTSNCYASFTLWTTFRQGS